MAIANDTSLYSQVSAFKKGNEMAVLAAKQINYHLMGYYPITPSTEIAEDLDELKAQNEHEIVMIPADGEHGAAGICYGASVGGGRVLNATSANGLLYAMEQLPVQSGTRFPMVLNVVTRAVSGPLDIRGDHSDIMYALNTGWLILMARDPQAVYDMNVLALRIAEHKDVRLPIMIAYDGFFTSHQKRRVQYFEHDEAVRSFIGEAHTPIHALDPEKPVTIGPYMNDPDLINNKYQMKIAMEHAEHVIPEVFAEYEKISGRHYDVVDTYQLEDADVALFILNSAAESAKDAADQLRSQGKKVGVISPNVIRPFPHKEIQDALRHVKVVLVAERADAPGANGGPITGEVKGALKDDPANRSQVMSRIYGLGGKDFYTDNAVTLFEQALEVAQTGHMTTRHDFLGANPGNPNLTFEYAQPPIKKEEVTLGLVQAWEENGKVQVKVATPRQLTEVPDRIASGHGACPGCGIFPSLNQFFRGIEGNVIVLFHTGCGMVVTTGYPTSSHRVTYIHNLFQNGAPTLSGLVEMFHERVRRGEIPDSEFTFVMVTGDGGMDIGMGPTIGTALRGHGMIILEYDNEGYMNTGNQQSYATPIGHSTSTSHVGPGEKGKTFHHKDTAQIMAATNIPYVFTSVEGPTNDLIKKAAKAQWYARHGMLAYGKVLSDCPLSWRHEDNTGTRVVQAAVDSCFFPMYEIERGITTITYDPEARGKKIPVSDWLNMMGKTRHLTKPENKAILDGFQEEVERRWARLKAKHEHPLL